MTSPKEDPSRLQAEGYWAVEVWLGGGDTSQPRYLCHAANDKEARWIGGQVMGSSSTVHGFGYYRLKLPIQNQPAGSLPALGEWKAVGPEAWADLMVAKAAFEAA